MDRRKRIPSILCCTLFLVGIVRTAGAFYVDPKKNSLEVIGRLSGRVSIRLQDSDGFTQPIDTSTGNLVQWLNLALVGINHDIQE